MELKKTDYASFCDLIYERTGLSFGVNKWYLIKKRLENRVSELMLDSFEDYLRLLKRRDQNRMEFDKLLNTVTTNETYFFREFEQLRIFAEHCLTEVCERKRSQETKHIRIWSAGCSTGEEPYTLAIILNEMLDTSEDWKSTVYATDINGDVLQYARRGVYSERSVRRVPDNYLAKHFRKRDGQYQISEAIKEKVEFESLNLSDAGAMERVTGVDFVFCRNVLIYFDALSQKRVVNSFYQAMNPGAFIYLGHAEAVSRMSSAFAVRRIDGTVVYQKAEDEYEKERVNS